MTGALRREIFARQSFERERAEEQLGPIRESFLKILDLHGEIKNTHFIDHRIRKWGDVYFTLTMGGIKVTTIPCHGAKTDPDIFISAIGRDGQIVEYFLDSQYPEQSYKATTLPGELPLSVSSWGDCVEELPKVVRCLQACSRAVEQVLQDILV